MPVHIETMNSEVGILDSDLPLSEAQLDKLTRLVLERLERQQRAAERSREATTLRPQAAPSFLPEGDGSWR